MKAAETNDTENKIEWERMGMEMNNRMDFRQEARGGSDPGQLELCGPQGPCALSKTSFSHGKLKLQHMEGRKTILTSRNP